MNTDEKQAARAAEAQHQAYVSAARKALAPFLALEYDWDSYRGWPVAYEVAGAGERLLVELAKSGRPAPWLCPTSSGGLSLEWHGPDIELTISLDPAEKPTDPPKASIYFCDKGADEEWELPDLSSALDRLPAAFARLAELTETARLARQGSEPKEMT